MPILSEVTYYVLVGTVKSKKLEPPDLTITALQPYRAKKNAGLQHSTHSQLRCVCCAADWGSPQRGMPV